MKTEVYSWRLSPTLKADLERAARKRGKSLAALLEEVSRAWLDDQQQAEHGRQQSVRQAARSYVGKISGGDPARSEQVQESVRDELERK